MLNEEFKNFYYLDLKKKDILEHILIAGYPEILIEVLDDKFYSFNKNFVFDYILKLINDKNYLKNITRQNIMYYFKIYY